MEVNDEVFEMLSEVFKPEGTYTKYEVKMLCLDAMKWAIDNANDEVENFDPKQFFKLNNLD